MDAQVSIIIPTRNRRDLLVQTLRSIQDQDFDRWEAIIVDDGSDDGSRQAVADLSTGDHRIKFFCRTGSATGANVCRNQGMARASGEFILFLDSDDLLDRGCLSGRVAYMRANPDMDLAIYGSNRFRQRRGDREASAPTSAGDELDHLLQLKCNWMATGPFWRREFLHKLGPWDESLPSWQDWEFHIRALATGARHQRVPTADWHWREPASESQTVGRSSMQPDHLRRRSILFDDIFRLLSKRGLMTARRRQLMGALNLYHCEWLALGISPHLAIERWGQCHRAGLIDSLQYREGFFYFRMWRHSYRARRMLRRYLRYRWKPDYEFID